MLFPVKIKRTYYRYADCNYKMAFANKALAETIDVNIQSLSLIYNETFGLSYSLKQRQI